MWTPTTRRHHNRTGLRYASDLTDAEWALLEPLLPPPCDQGRPRCWRMRGGQRDLLRAALGCPWRSYNGGAWHETPAMQLEPDLFSRDLNLCITGALACAQAVYPHMRAGGRGTLLFTGGRLALHPEYGAGVSSLTAGKAGLRAFVFALAKELAPEGLHVATVTIAGTVKPGTAFDPDRIAEQYWALHAEPANGWSVERVFDGKEQTTAA